MRQSERNKRNYLIVGLCSILMIMAVGFAAFSQQLKINGTSDVTSSWDVHIKNNGVSYKNAVQATSTLAEKTSALVATFACQLVTPGVSTISYDVVVENKGSLNAKLDSINLTGGNSAISVVTSPTNASLSTSPIVLGPDDETTITVIVSYNNINTQPTGDGLSTNITATLNFSQTNDAPVQPAQAFTGTIYRHNSNLLFNGLTMSGEATLWYPSEDYSSVSEAHADYYTFSSQAYCEADVGSGNCSSGTVTITPGSYETQASNLNKAYYLKHEIVNDIVTASYVCFVTDTEHCLRGGVDECLWDNDADNGNGACTFSGTPTVYNSNVGVLSSQQSWFTSQNPAGSCSLYPSGSDSSCVGGPFGNMYAESNGYVGVSGTDGASCSVNSVGSSRCSGELGIW